MSAPSTGLSRSERGGFRPLLVTVRQAKQLLSIGHTKTYELIKSGALETVKVDKRRMIKFDSIERLAAHGCNQETATP
jgi:excisionase family DNA binding protein